MSFIRISIALSLLVFGHHFANGATCDRGTLSEPYCDRDYDLIADLPKDSSQWIDPKTLIISFAPFEDYITTANIFNPFIDYLETCLQRRVIFYPMQSNEAEIAAMRAGRIHLAGFSTGSLISAVNNAGAVPFATQANEQGLVGANLIVIVRSDSNYHTLSDLKNRRVAHSNPTSLTGHLGALALFPAEGLIPGVDYTIRFSGKHDQSILGVKSGDYDAATTTTEILNRMIQYQEVDADDFKIIYQSQTFPSAAFSYAHNLAPSLTENIKSCFFAYQFPEAMQQGFKGSLFFSPINYQQDWQDIHQILLNVPQP